MDRMDLDELHREQAKRARSINPSISDLRLAVDAAAEMQVRARQQHLLKCTLRYTGYSYAPSGSLATTRKRCLRAKFP